MSIPARRAADVNPHATLHANPREPPMLIPARRADDAALSATDTPPEQKFRKILLLFFSSVPTRHDALRRAA